MYWFQDPAGVSSHCWRTLWRMKILWIQCGKNSIERSQYRLWWQVRFEWRLKSWTLWVQFLFEVAIRCLVVGGNWLGAVFIDRLVAFSLLTQCVTAIANCRGIKILPRRWGVLELSTWCHFSPKQKKRAGCHVLRSGCSYFYLSATAGLNKINFKKRESKLRSK